MTMEHTEDNPLQEQPLFTIEHETDDPTAEAVGEAPIITIEHETDDPTAEAVGEAPIITIEHETDDPTAEAVGEAPIITIEHYNVEDERQLPPAVKKRSALQTWSLRLLWFVSAAVLLVGLYAATRLYNYYYNLGVSISVSPTDNLRKLDRMRMENGPSEVQLKRDSVLGVALDIYEWHNVKAELTLAEPDTADHNVLLYTRTADYTATGEYIGSLVVDGEEKQSDVSRLGYCALKNGFAVIGISRFDDLRSAMVDADGSYFRQFVLVSDGQLPPRFTLHGKVERKALVRTADDQLCVVATRHPETLWSFADALREYGYVDAIYLTGGNQSGFYRAPDGTPYFTEEAARYRTDKHHGVAPWLVLRKR